MIDENDDSERGDRIEIEHKTVCGETCVEVVERKPVDSQEDDN